MLRRLAVQAWRLHLQSLELRSNGQGPLLEEARRSYSTKVPTEYQGYYLHKPLQPKPKPAPQPAPEASSAVASEAAPAAAENFQDNVSTAGARAGTFTVACACSSKLDETDHGLPVPQLAQTIAT